VAADADLFFGAEYRLFEFEMQIFAKICAALGAAATASSLAGGVAKSEDVAKNIAEVLKNGGIESGGSSTAAQAGVAEAIVDGTLLAIGEDGVGLGDFLELIFRFRVIRIAVGMIGHRQLAVSALDFDIGGGASDPEDLIKIAFCISGQNFLFP
jgi:hypothetical protein